jgi:soluble lytic murein transglycosylase-like protein
LDKYGTTNAKAHMKAADFYEAQAAAQSAGIETSDVLALWDNETSFDSTRYWTKRGSGDIGPMQVTPSARKDLARLKELPQHYNTNLSANVLAGARYYAVVLNNYGVPEGEAAAAYNGGYGAWKNDELEPRHWDYQNNFDQKKVKFDDLVHCLRGGH